MQTPIFPNTLELDRVIEELDELFPDNMPDYQISEKEFSYRCGQVSVVRYLKDKYLKEE